MTKHFWINKPITNADSYCVNLYGVLANLNLNKIKGRSHYEFVFLKYDEIIEILNIKTKQEKYSLCDKLFNEKFPQSEENKKELSKDEQSKLERLFP